MFRAFSQNSQVAIRQVQYRDVDAIEQLCPNTADGDQPACSTVREKSLSIRHWYGLLKLLSLFPNPFQNSLCVYVAELNQRVQGVIRVSPFNRTGSTWRVDQVAVAPVSKVESGDEPQTDAPVLTKMDVGSLLLRYCLERIWQARIWILEIDINDQAALALYRQNGFQPLANMTYWSLSAEQLHDLSEREPDLPNLLPVSNADAQLLYQLDTMAMPPLVRQVFDRHIQDFKTSLFGSLIDWAKQWLTGTECVSGYVFEPQRKAAIGYFQVRLCRDGSQPHNAQLTVNPAYTWLYPELMAQMARITREVPPQSLQMVSPDYQPERENYLELIGANRIGHTLLMSRSVWHKVRETKSIAEGLQIADMLQGLQPTRKPVPGRISMLTSAKQPPTKPKQDSTGTDAHGSDRCC
ncbi:GNAT family N-acetyltransferase [Myxacorys almedinensis]|uniref:GNAT family N-acetyltransferase n=1 Tax=Myxacorys almedinensis TaxID=2651157 RepID=UPI00192EC786|nr:GNAT family N-acetyltransferase [Myxacorys almedinensis]